MRLRLLMALVTTLGAAGANATGWYNVPSNLPQHVNFGFGPGYHAPSLRVRPCKSENAGQATMWLPGKLAPPCPDPMLREPLVYGDFPRPAPRADSSFGEPTDLMAPSPALTEPPSLVPSTQGTQPSGPQREVLPAPARRSDSASPSDLLEADPISIPAATYPVGRQWR